MDAIMPSFFLFLGGAILLPFHTYQLSALNYFLGPLAHPIPSRRVKLEDE